MAHAHAHHGAERVLTGKRLSSSAEMNVTPLIDVLLVLLVIFMSVLPLTQKGEDVNLPLESAPHAVTDTSQQVVVEYTADHQLTVNKQPQTLGTLQDFLTTVFSSRRDKTLFIIGAGSLRYGDIVQVIDAAHGAGVTKVGIVTESMRNPSAGG